MLVLHGLLGWAAKRYRRVPADSGSHRPQLAESASPKHLNCSINTNVSAFFRMARMLEAAFLPSCTQATSMAFAVVLGSDYIPWIWLFRRATLPRHLTIYAHMRLASCVCHRPSGLDVLKSMRARGTWLHAQHLLNSGLARLRLRFGTVAGAGRPPAAGRWSSHDLG